LAIARSLRPAVDPTGGSGRQKDHQKLREGFSAESIFCLALAASVGIAFWMGESLAARFGQATVYQTSTLQAPNAELAVLFASLR
jgi:hypothetical protein